MLSQRTLYLVIVVNIDGTDRSSRSSKSNNNSIGHCLKVTVCKVRTAEFAEFEQHNLYTWLII